MELKVVHHPGKKKTLSEYTNCILTNYWADGRARTPCMLFTYNPHFQLKKNGKQAHDQKVDYLVQMMENYGIKKRAICYLGKEKNETRRFVKESPQLSEIYFDRYKKVGRKLILRDAGDAFLKEKKPSFAIYRV